ncbi:MAG TPA: glycosyltransferase [Vicinamibacterales bacterium]|nr:glycosyltransferase [Vicinamibacterales bacterium]
MRIVHALGWYFPDSLGGTEVYVDGLCRRQLRAGHRVAVAAPDAGATAERVYAHHDVPVYRYPIPAVPTRAEAQGLVPVRGAERFHAWLRGQRPTIVHFHGFVTGLGLHEVRAAAGAGARTVLTNHLPGLGFLCRRGTLMRWGRRPCDGVCRPAKCAACVLQQKGLPRPLADAIGVLTSPVSGALGRLSGPIGTGLGLNASIRRDQAHQKELMALLDAFVVLNRRAAAIIGANGLPDEAVVVNRLGVSQTGLVPKPGPDRRPSVAPITVGFLGRIDPTKGPDVLVRAVTRLAADLPLRVEIRGPVSGPAGTRYLRALQAAAAGDPRVTVGPPLAPDEVGAVLARYDLLCCPSLWFENGPTVAIEAQAVGTPVIASRIGALPELIDDGVNGRLFDAGDEGALAAILNEVARTPAGTIDRWRLALPPARTMDAIAADYEALYTRLAAVPRAS